MADILQTNQTFMVKKTYNVSFNSTYGAEVGGVCTSITTNGATTIIVTNLVGGAGTNYTETNTIIPIVSGCGIIFQDNGQFLVGEMGQSTFVALAEVNITPYPSSCACSQGNPPAGGPGPMLGSVAQHMSLGVTAYGQAVGELWFLADTPTPALATPGGLGLLAVPGLATAIHDPTTGWLRQVGASQCLADIVQVSSYEYHVVFYATNAFIPGHDDTTLIPTNGLTPFVTWIIENPDGSGGTNRLQIMEVRDSFEITNLFTWNTNSQTLYFDSGNGLKRESLAKT